MFNEPAIRKIISNKNPIAISYEIICAEDRKAPKKEYFVLEDHPEQITPYTPKEDTAKRYKIPILISAKTTPSPKGITAQDITAKKKVRIGAIKKTALLTEFGITVSFNKSFAPSAKGCSKP